jgi:pimeloyl-ACP methyl ester carboxylesterase
MPNRSYSQYADDVSELMKHLRIKNAIFVGHSAGCPHVCGIAYKHPELVTKLILLCPPTPIVSPTHETPQEPFGRKVQVFMIRQLPGLMNWMLSKMILTWVNDPKKFIASAHKDLSAGKDMDIVKEHPEYEKEVLDSFQKGVNKDNYHCVIDDMMIASHFWGFNVSEIKVPTTVWWGGLDTVTPHGEWMAKTIPNAKSVKKSDYGHGLPWGNWNSIMTEFTEEESQ